MTPGAPDTPEPVERYWSRHREEVIAALGASAEGLAGTEARSRLQRFGPNTVQEESRLSAVRLLLRQFESPLVLILILAAAISLVLREWVDAFIILVIVAGSALLGFSQEHRASKAVAALRCRLALQVRVLRDAALVQVPAAQLVPGDVIELTAGNRVPADGLLLEARDFLVSEASLTGESFPVEKQPGVVAPGASLAGRTNCAFLGTSVRSGTARMLVVGTGRRTAFGAVAGRLAARPAETEFGRGVRHFGELLLRVMILMVVFVLVVNQVLGRPPLESLLFAVALAVGLSPELLPAIVSVTLAHGARSMARGGAIVRRLEAIENLGAIDVLCTDKTGTLTSGTIALEACLDPAGTSSHEVSRLAFLNAAFETGIENPLDAAIVSAGKRDGLANAGHAKIDEIPYDFNRRRLTIVVAPESDPGHHLIVTKGAYANVLAACTSLARDAGEVPLDEGERGRLEAFFRERGEAGYRVLALATRRVAARPRYGREDEQEMRFEGWLVFLDPPLPHAAATLRDLEALGIQTKIITGDNRHIASHVARAVGLDPRRILTGDKIARLSGESLSHLAGRTVLFAEVDPQQKERIVQALQKAGHAVGFLGDGINDAPALLAADVGISVDQAVDVARESADVVLLRPDLQALRRGVEEGRRTFANTLKYIGITTSANFGNMASMALAAPLLPFLPLAAKQILLNNFLSDLPSMAIATDRVDPTRLARAQRWNMTEVRRFMIVFGLVSTVFDLLTFALLLQVFKAGEATFQTAWFVVSLLTELAVVLVLRTEGSAFASRPGTLLLVTTVVVAIAAIGLPYYPPFASLFGFVPLPAHLLGASLLVVAGYIVCTEIAKRRFY